MTTRGDRLLLAIEERLHLYWHMSLILAAAFVAVHPEYAWLSPVLQVYGQITPPPGFPGTEKGGA